MSRQDNAPIYLFHKKSNAPKTVNTLLKERYGKDADKFIVENAGEYWSIEIAHDKLKEVASHIDEGTQGLLRRSGWDI